MPAANATVSTIMNLLTAWDGLSLIQQRMPSNRDFLVGTTEDAVLQRHEAFVKAAEDMKAPGDDYAKVVVTEEDRRRLAALKLKRKYLHKKTASK